jgi:putative ABC transport system permease protein
VAPSVVGVAPTVQGNVEIAAGGEKTTTQLAGVTPPYFAMRNYKVGEGELLTQEHELGRASVVLLGTDVADKLFDRHEGVVGETVRIDGQPFRVIGIMEKKGGSSFGSQDDVAFVPMSTARVRILRRASNRVDLILVEAASADDVTRASDEISQVLRTRHRNAVGTDDFTVFSQQDFLQTAQTITGVLTIFLGGIAAISLVVGGIGIMNIMLVSVAERTREIGLRKALGARRRDILVQFLAESSLLSLMGGIIGIILGWLISFVVGRIAAANGTVFNPTVSLGAVLLATVFSTAVGLFFGIYPANRAAGLEPVEALRYE